MADKPVVAKTWTFESSDFAKNKKTYETLQYADGSTSCDCKGWTQKVDPHGNRSCRHTRLVHQGLADREAIGQIDYTKDNPALRQTFEKALKVQDTLGKGKRALSL